MQTPPLHQLSDADLETAVKRLAVSERCITAQLIEHLAEFDGRRLFLAAGFSSMFTYCCAVLRLSESAAYNRIEAARAARTFPILLEGLRAGSFNLTTLRLIAPHLTPSKQEALIAECSGKSKREVEQLVARIAPRSDVAASIRKLPARSRQPRLGDPVVQGLPEGQPPAQASSAMPPVVTTAAAGLETTRPAHPIVAPLAPDRFQIRFTASAATCEKLRLAQDLLRHAIPGGDPAQIIDRALTLLLEDVARKKVPDTRRPRASDTARPAEAHTVVRRTRHIPVRLKRAVWLRDQGRCAFTSKVGRRCNERAFVEFHHVDPHGVGGEPAVSNIELRCHAHNVYEAVLFYGPDAAARGGRSGTSTAPRSTPRAAGMERRPNAAVTGMEARTRAVR